MWKKRDKGEATKATTGGRGGAGGSSRINRRGGAVIGSKKAAEKVCSKGRRFMKYHSFMAVLQSLTTAVPGEELEVQACEKGPKIKHGSENDSGCDQIDGCEDTTPVAGKGLKHRE